MRHAQGALFFRSKWASGSRRNNSARQRRAMLDDISPGLVRVKKSRTGTVWSNSLQRAER